MVAGCTRTGPMQGGRPDDGGWYFWRVDFADLRQAGTIGASVTADEVHVESPPLEVARGVLLWHTARSAVDLAFPWQTDKKQR